MLAQDQDGGLAGGECGEVESVSVEAGLGRFPTRKPQLSHRHPSGRFCINAYTTARPSGLPHVGQVIVT